MTKKPSALAKLLGISQAKYDSLSPAQKIALIDKALPRADEATARKLRFSRQAIERWAKGIRPPKRNKAKPDKWIQRAVKKPGRLHTILGISQDKYDSLTKEQKLSRIAKALEKIEGVETKKAKSERGALLFAERAVTGGGFKKTKRNPSEHKQVWDDAFVAGWKAAKRAKREVPPAKAYAKVDSAKYGIDWIDGYAAYADWKRGAYATANVKRAKSLGLTGKENPSSATLTAAQKVTLVTAFTHIRRQAAKVLPALAKVGLAVDSSIHDSPRHYAMTTATRSSATIYVAPEMAKLPKAQLDGVLMHEFGHAAVEMTGGHGSGSYDAKENKADRMAERLFGVKISYTSKGVETTGRGTRPRPAGLR